MKKYMVMTDGGTVVYATNSMIKCVAWVIANCLEWNSEEETGTLPDGTKVHYFTYQSQD